MHVGSYFVNFIDVRNPSLVVKVVRWIDKVVDVVELSYVI